MLFFEELTSGGLAEANRYERYAELEVEFVERLDGVSHYASCGSFELLYI